jgi:protein involved in polysaccharide export with SLBB domain
LTRVAIHSPRPVRNAVFTALCFVLALSTAGLKSAHAQAPNTVNLEAAGSTHDEVFVAGEALTIEVALDTAAFLGGGYPIDSAGFVELPILGKYLVAGRSRDELEAFLGQKFANYLRDTHIKVMPAIRLTLLGFWIHQGMYYVNPKSTVWEAVYISGGMAGERTIDEIEVKRGTTTTRISFLDEYSRGATLQAAGFHSGDIIVVPIPRENTGFWYWFTQGITTTAQIATILTSAMSAYIIYINIQNLNNPR